MSAVHVEVSQSGQKVEERILGKTAKQSFSAGRDMKGHEITVTIETLAETRFLWLIANYIPDSGIEIKDGEEHTDEATGKSSFLQIYNRPKDTMVSALAIHRYP